MHKLPEGLRWPGGPPGTRLYTLDFSEARFTDLPSLRIDTSNIDARTAEIAGEIKRVVAERQMSISNEILLAQFGDKAQTLKALGWLAAEGNVKNRIYGIDVQAAPESLSEEELKTIREGKLELFTAPGQLDFSIQNRFTGACAKAFRYGMWRRQMTLNKEVAGEDSEIGNLAGVILRSSAENAPKTTFANLVDQVYRNGKFGNPLEVEKGFMVAAAAGRSIAKDDVVMNEDIKGPTLLFSLRVGRTHIPEETATLPQKAELMFKGIPEGKGIELGQLIKKDGGSFQRAMLFGFLLERGRLKFEDQPGQLMVHRV